MTLLINDNGTQREMTEEEEESYLAMQKEQMKEAKAKQAIATAKQEAKLALLEKLGITEEEAKLLLG
jgi:hypothetical protein